MFFNKRKQENQCAFLDGQQKIVNLQEDIWRLNREMRTLYEALNETQSSCALLMDRLGSASHSRAQPK